MARLQIKKISCSIFCCCRCLEAMQWLRNICVAATCCFCCRGRLLHYAAEGFTAPPHYLVHSLSPHLLSFLITLLLLSVYVCICTVYTKSVAYFSFVEMVDHMGPRLCRQVGGHKIFITMSKQNMLRKLQWFVFLSRFGDWSGLQITDIITGPLII